MKINFAQTDKKLSEYAEFWSQYSLVDDDMIAV